MVVNTAVARRIARQGDAVSQAVDRTLTLGPVSARVVGVVEDGFVEARAYRPAAATTNAAAVTFLVRTEAAAAEALAALRSRLAAQLPREARPMVGTWRDANLRGLDESSRVGALLGLLALLLAGAGVAGSMAFHGRQRAREIAVRRALGATTSALLRLVAAQAARITGIGLALGLALGWLGTHALLSLMGGPPCRSTGSRLLRGRDLRGDDRPRPFGRIGARSASSRRRSSTRMSSPPAGTPRRARCP